MLGIGFSVPRAPTNLMNVLVYSEVPTLIGYLYRICDYPIRGFEALNFAYRHWRSKFTTNVKNDFIHFLSAV